MHLKSLSSSFRFHQEARNKKQEYHADTSITCIYIDSLISHGYPIMYAHQHHLTSQFIPRSISFYSINTISHHHHISVMELGHLLTRSGLTCPEVFSNVCHDSFCQLWNSVSLPWVIYYGAFYLHVVSSFSCIPVICLKFVLFLISYKIN